MMVCWLWSFQRTEGCLILKLFSVKKTLNTITQNSRFFENSKKNPHNTGSDWCHHPKPWTGGCLKIQKTHTNNCSDDAITTSQALGELWFCLWSLRDGSRTKRERERERQRERERERKKREIIIIIRLLILQLQNTRLCFVLPGFPLPPPYPIPLDGIRVQSDKRT